MLDCLKFITQPEISLDLHYICPPILRSPASTHDSTRAHVTISLFTINYYRLKIFLPNYEQPMATAQKPKRMGGDSFRQYED